MLNPKLIKIVLYSAAIYNWYSAVTLFFYPIFMPINGMEPLPNHPLFITMLSSLIATFGFAYFWAARDLLNNIPLLKLGVMGKVLVFCAVGYVYISLGDSLSTMMFGFTIIDLIYAGFFLTVIANVNKQQAG